MKIWHPEEDLWHIVKNLEKSGPIGTQCENDVVGAFTTPSVESQEGIFTDEFTLSPSHEVAPVKDQGTMTSSQTQVCNTTTQTTIENKSVLLDVDTQTDKILDHDFEITLGKQ